MSKNQIAALEQRVNDLEQMLALLAQHIQITNGAVSIQSESNVSIQALNISLNANVSAVVKGAASAELSASGQTTVKGAMVMIN